MKESNDVFESLGGSFFKYLIASADSRNNNAPTKLMLVALAILAFVGVEAVKLVFRNNFGSKGLNIWKFILSAVAFGIIAKISYTYWVENPIELSEGGSPASYILTAAFYGFIAVFILIKGAIAKSKPNDIVSPYYRGDSVLFNFLMRDKWEQATIQNVAEPLFTLALGFFLLSINTLLGVPIIFCAISVWLQMIIESVFGDSEVRDKLANEGRTKHTQGEFSEVI